MSNVKPEGIRHVIVAGHDATVWMSALALLRAFGRTGLTVEVVETPSLLRRADVYPSLPTLRAFHRLLGLDTAEMIRATAATYMLGQRYAGFLGNRPPFLIAHASTGGAIRNLPFLPFWLRARKEGLKAEYDAFSLGATAALNGRFAVPPPGAAGLEATDYGFNMHAGSYARWLKTHALKRGVRHTPVPGFTPEAGPNGLEALILPDGRRLTADLYLDATGPQARLMNAIGAGAQFDDSAALPCDRLLVTATAPLKPLPLFSQVSAHRHGWLGLYPLQAQTSMVMAYDSAGLSDDAAYQQAATLSGFKPDVGATVTPIKAGRLKTLWQGNTVAIGDAAASLEAGEGLTLHLAHVTLTHLLSLFPVRRDLMPEAQMYQEVVGMHFERLLDYLTVRFSLNRRFDEPLWDRLRDAPLSEPLRYKIDLFKARGLIALYEREAINEDSWISLLLGMGLVPEAYDPQIDQAPPEEIIQRFQYLLAYIKERVTQMPTHEALLMEPAGASEWQ